MVVVVLKSALWLAGAVAGFAACAAVYHCVMRSREKGSLVPNGVMVSVDGHNMHVYAEGKKGGHTLVVMAGSGVAAPVYDYKVLYSRLSDEYRVVVIEKFGYGYSDISALPRNVETMVTQNRQALFLAGEKAPYVLMPHSMSALEALYWAVNFPGEVRAIIGLDAAVPETYAPFTDTYTKIKLQRLAALFGLHRIPFFNPVSERGLSPDEVRQHRFLSYRVTLNGDVMAEIAAVNENAKKVLPLGASDIPMLLFASSIGGPWAERQRGFAARSDKITLIRLNCGHNVHYYESEYIAGEIKRFITGLPGE